MQVRIFPRSISSFNEISDLTPSDHSFYLYKIVYTGTDPDAPDTGSRAWWWNVLVFGPSSRQTQIAFCPFKNADTIYFRQIHDSRKYGWYKISGTQV